MFFIQSNIFSQCYIMRIFWDDSEKLFPEFSCHQFKSPVSKASSIYYQVIDSFGMITRGERITHNEAHYNENGVLKKEISFYPDDDYILTAYEYELGRKKFETKYNSKGELLSKNVFTKEGRILREQIYNRDGTRENIYYIYTFNEGGSIIKKEFKCHIPEGNSIPIYFSYDNYKRISKIKNGRYQYTITYDDIQKKPIKYIFFDTIKKKVIIELLFEYNNKGDMIKIIENGKLSLYHEYTYDEKDNWITRIDFQTEAKIPYTIVNRKIEYLK